MIKWIIYLIILIFVSWISLNFWNPTLYPFFKMQQYNRINKLFIKNNGFDYILSILYYLKNLLLIWFQAGSKKLSYFSYFQNFFKKLK